MIIGDLKQENLPLVAKLWQESFVFHQTFDSQYYKENSPELAREILDYLVRSLSDHKIDRKIKLAILGKKVVGFIIFSIQTEFEFDQNPEPYGCIQELFVDSKCRGEGVGSALLEVARSWFKGQNIRQVRIQAAFHNEKALGFYQSKGFEIKQVILSDSLRLYAGV